MIKVNGVPITTNEFNENHGYILAKEYMLTGDLLTLMTFQSLGNVYSLVAGLSKALREIIKESSTEDGRVVYTNYHNLRVLIAHLAEHRQEAIIRNYIKGTGEDYDYSIRVNSHQWQGVFRFYISNELRTEIDTVTFTSNLTRYLGVRHNVG